MVRSEKDEAYGAQTKLIFDGLIEELLLDCVLQAHRDVAKGSTMCKTCNTKCNSVHLPGSLASTSGLTVPSRSGTPSSNGDKASTPKNDGNLLLECHACSRQIASNRYAPHLASCMGLSTSRRGATRKSKLPSEPGRSVSPSSELGYNSDERKAKRKDDEFTLKRKRPTSPQVTPGKKSKTKMSGSPIFRVKAETGIPGPHYSPTTKSQSRVPSKLRDSSIAPDNYSSEGSSSDMEEVSMATPASSSFTKSPALAARPVPAKRGRPPGTGTGPPKRLSPPRSAPVLHFEMDVDGDETGSSTDSSSDS